MSTTRYASRPRALPAMLSCSANSLSDIPLWTNRSDCGSQPSFWNGLGYGQNKAVCKEAHCTNHRNDLSVCADATGKYIVNVRRS